MANQRERQKRQAKKRARREKRVSKQVAYLQRSAPRLVSKMMALPKMSEALLDFAAPLIGEPRRGFCAAEARPLLLFAATIWNLTCLIDGGADDHGDGIAMRLEIVENLTGDTRQARDECENMVDTFIERKRDLFGDDPRVVVDVEVIDTPDGIHVMAASRL